MTTFTERDRAKRAKLKARYDSIKQKSARGDGGTYSPMPNSPKPNSAEICDRRDDEHFNNATVSASDSASRDAAPSSSSARDDASDRNVDVPVRAMSNNSPARSKANQLAIAKKKLAASRKATSPVKNAYSYSPVLETHQDKTAPAPIEEKDSEPYTPPRVVSKRAEMARKLAASRAATSSPQPPIQNPDRRSNSSNGKMGVNSSAYVKNNTFGNNSRASAAAGSTKFSSRPLDRKQQQTGRAQTIDKVVVDKRASTRSNELARLRAASPAVVAAATAKPKVYSTNNDTTIFACESDGDESSMWDECLAKDAVLQRREQFRKKQEGSKDPVTVSDTSFRQPSKTSNQYIVQHHAPSIRQQFLEKQEENRRARQSFHQPSFEKRDGFNGGIQNNIAPTVGISDPPLTIVSRSSSQEKSMSEIQTNSNVQPPAHGKEESEIVAQDFGEGFGFSQEEFSHASWGLGPAFSSEIIANDDADWSRPLSCSDKEVASTKRVDDERDHAVEIEDKENVNAMTNATQGEYDVSPVATASVQYVDFGVGKSRGGSVDCDSTIDERDELNKSIVSEETTASATEFDPLSMFGGSDEASQQLEISEDNAQGKVPLVISKEESSVSSSPEDGSNSISFPSLNSGALLKPPKHTQQLQANSSSKTPPPPPPPAKNVMKAPPDSPSGTESLESWWQSRYASSQNNDINSAVQEALLNETSSASKKSQADSSKNMSGVSTLSNSLTPVRSNEQEPTCEINDDESCSIFSGISGIDDDIPKESNFHTDEKQNLVNAAAQSKDLGEIEEEEEDIFSGVSVSQTKDLQVDDIAMKSVMGGNSSGFTLMRANAESNSMLYGPNAVAMSPYAKCKVMNSLADGISTTSFSSPKLQNANATSQYMRESYEPLSSLSENNYGVIELKNNEKSSPANSHTSDITSSVIFGCDPPKRIAHQRYEVGHEKILETNESEEAEESMISQGLNVTVKSEQAVEDEVSKSIIANRAVSLVAPSTCDSTSQGSTFDQTKTTGMNTDAESEASPYFGLSGLRDQAKAAILSRFSCGLLNTSSFACLPKENGHLCKQGDQVSNETSLNEESNNSSESEKPHDSPDNQFNDGSSRRTLEVSSKIEAPPPPPFSPQSIRLRETSFGKGGVEVMSEAVANAATCIGTQNELPVYKSASEAQKEAYEALLLYAYTALSVPPPEKIVEKGLGAKTTPIIYPSIDGGVNKLGVLVERFQKEGISVLKLNSHNQWQPRILTVTKEIHVFNKSDDDRFKDMDSCPKGLLWLKKFSRSEQTVASIKKGKGGIFFSTIDSVSVTKGIHPLSKKQQKGTFKNSFTFVLFSNDNGSKREIYFRVASKDDVILLSAGFQAIIDRAKDDKQRKSKTFKLTVDTLNATAGESNIMSPILSPTKPLITKKAVAHSISDHRWEV